MNQILKRFGLEIFGVGTFSLLVLNNLPFLTYPFGILGFLFTYAIVKYGYKIINAGIFNFDVLFDILSVGMKKEYSVVKKGNSIVITIDGKHIIVPYDRELVRKYIGKRVFLVENDGCRMEVIPYPGVPFISTASDLAIGSIEVVDENDD